MLPPTTNALRKLTAAGELLQELEDAVGKNSGTSSWVSLASGRTDRRADGAGLGLAQVAAGTTMMRSYVAM